MLLARDTVYFQRQLSELEEKKKTNPNFWETVFFTLCQRDFHFQCVRDNVTNSENIAVLFCQKHFQRQLSVLQIHFNSSISETINFWCEKIILLFCQIHCSLQREVSEYRYFSSECSDAFFQRQSNFQCFRDSTCHETNQKSQSEPFIFGQRVLFERKMTLCFTCEQTVLKPHSIFFTVFRCIFHFHQETV